MECSKVEMAIGKRIHAMRHVRFLYTLRLTCPPKPLGLRSLGACAPKRYSAQVRRRLAQAGDSRFTGIGEQLKGEES